jgi:hypothetical protein
VTQLEINGLKDTYIGEGEGRKGGIQAAEDPYAIESFVISTHHEYKHVFIRVLRHSMDGADPGSQRPRAALQAGGCQPVAAQVGNILRLGH